MNPQTFLKEFSTIANAPGGIQRLREMILQLAMMGKLVEQDPDDEPARELLERINSKKKKHLNSKRNIQPTNISENGYYSVPSGWVTCQLGDLVLSITGGGTPSKNNTDYWNGNIPWASVKDLKDSKYLEKTIDKITAKGLSNSSSNLIPAGCYIVCTRMGLGKSAINKIEIAINQDLKALEIPEDIEIDYFHILYRTRVVAGTGMTVKGIKQKDLLALPALLPPLNEQQRIVAKVDQLMSLCDQLEAQQQRRSELVRNARVSVLEALADAQGGDELKTAWNRVKDNLPLLFEAPEDVEDLKKCILQNAVMGKLVPQDPSDEPASELLKKIAKEKAELIRKKEIKKQKPLPEIREAELPFQIPKGWDWCRFQDTFYDIRYGTSKKCYQNRGSVAVLRIPNLISGRVDRSNLKFTDLTPKEVEDLSLEKGDLLLIRSNGSLSLVGRSSIVEIEAENDAFAGYLMRIRIFKESINPEFIHFALESPFIRKAIEIPIRTTSGVKNINSTEVSQLLMPLPPLNEQKKIFKKVQSLISYCDTLNEQLDTSKKITEQLAQSIVESITGLSA